MPYPSILWSDTLEESREREPAVPESTLRDLLGDGDIRERSLHVLRIPCRREEIPGRQRLTMRMISDDAFARYVEKLRNDFSEAEQLFDEIRRSESEAEKDLLFLPAMDRFFMLAESLAELRECGDRAGEVGAFWHDWLGNVAHEAFRKRCRDILLKHCPAFRLRVHGSSVTAWERKNGVREDLERSLRDMGFADAIPQERYPQKAPLQIIEGFSGVYRGYAEMAAAYREECGEDYMGGGRDILPAFRYREELDYLLDVSAYFRALRDDGYPLCMPEVSQRREFILTGAVDPSLRRRNVPGTDLVPNEVRMTDDPEEGAKEQFFILSGANGGGKTTYLRTCSLAALFFTAGCPVAAKGGRCMPFDAVYTHFPSNESFESSGRFADEADRAEAIMEAAGEDSFAVFNETYSGTDEKKSGEYSARLAREMWSRGTFGIYVTHIHALTGGEIPTLAAEVDESDENRRTYRIRRVGATTSSFARDILEKYGLDAESLRAKAEAMRAEKGGE
jgi:hypothetical protein